MKFEFGKKREDGSGMQFRLDDAMVLLSICVLAITLFYFKTEAFAFLTVLAIFLFRQKLKMIRFWPIILGLTLLTLMSTYYHPEARFFIFILGLFITAYSLSITDRIKMEYAFMLAFFVGGIVTHVNSALRTDVLFAFDPWWHWRWIEAIDLTGAIPVHDYLTYPLKGGLDLSQGLFLYQVSVAGLSKLLLFYSAFETTILFSGVMAAFTIMVVFIGIIKLFDDEFPHNYLMAGFAAFMLMMSPAFAMKAVSGNAEEDAIGMLFLVTSMFLFIFAVKFNKRHYAVMSSLAFFMLALTWGGFMYGVIVCAIFTAAYSITQRFLNKDCIRHLEYFLIATSPGIFLTGLFLHPTGSLPVFVKPATMVLIPWGLALLIGTLLAFSANKSDRKMQMVFGTVMVLSILFLANFGPINAINFINDVFIKGARAETIVRQTISEQGMTAADLPMFFDNTYPNFGVALYLTPISFLLLGYYFLRKQSVGALFIMVWAIPMFYAAMNKSIFLFLASVPIIVLGSAIALYSIGGKKDLESMRIIGTVLILISLPLYLPVWDTATTGLNSNNETVMVGDTDFSRYVGGRIFRNGPGGDFRGWQPALQWFEEMTEPNQAVLTWWDYGHWLTAVSHRPVLIDNLQADQYEIQDVARFFVNKTTEEEAFEIIKKYQAVYQERNMSLDYVAIDFPMIPKSNALHYIASSDIDPMRQGSRKSLMACGFNPQISQLQPQIVPGSDGFEQTMVLRYQCGQQFILSFYTDGELRFKKLMISQIYVENNRLSMGPEINWKPWAGENGASVIGLHSTREIFSQSLVSIQNRNVPNPLKAFVLAPEPYADFMLTKMYFSEQLPEYANLGLYRSEVTPLEHFQLIQDVGYGYVRIYKINY